MTTNNQMTITSELTSLIAEVPAAQTRCSNIAALLGVSLAISPMDTPPEMEEPGAPVPNPTIPNPVRRTATSLEERAALLLEHPTDEIVLQFQTKAEYDARSSHPEYNGITCEYVCNGNVRSALLTPLFKKYEEMMHDGGDCLAAEVLAIQRAGVAPRTLHDSRTMAAQLCAFVTGNPIKKKNEKYHFVDKKYLNSDGSPNQEKLNKQGLVKKTYTGHCEMTNLNFLDNETKVREWINKTEGKAGGFAAKRQKSNIVVTLYTAIPINQRDDALLGRYRHMHLQYKEIEADMQHTRSADDVLYTPCAADLEAVRAEGSDHDRMLIQFCEEFHPRSGNLVLRVLTRVCGELYHYGAGRLGDECLPARKVHNVEPAGQLLRKLHAEELHADGYELGRNHIVIEEIDGKMFIENVQVDYKTDAKFGRQRALFSEKLVELTLKWLNSSACNQGSTLFQFEGKPVDDTQTVRHMFKSAFSCTDKLVTPRLLRYYLSNTPELKKALRLLVQIAAIKNHSLGQTCSTFYTGSCLCIDKIEFN